MKRYLIIFAALNLLVLAGCNTQPEIIQQTATPKFTKEFVVGGDKFSLDSIYGLVVADNTKNISTSVGGTISNFNCQPGQKVTRGTLIAKIIPDTSDVTTRNAILQQNVLRSQLSRLSQVSNSTDSNFDIQVSTLKSQKENNLQQLENLKKQRQLSTGDMALQIQSMDDQLKSLEISRDKDLEKITSSLDNLKKQNYNALTDAFTKLNDIFGIENKEKNSAYDTFLSAKNTALRSAVEMSYYKLKGQLDVLSGKTNDEISDFLMDTANLLKSAAEAMNQSVASIALPQSSTSPNAISIDGFYTIFNNLSNTILGNKTSFDNYAISYDAVNNSYKNQINTLTLNLLDLKNNKSIVSDIQIDNQIKNLELAINLADDQLNSIQNNKVIQLNNLDNQILSLQQNYQSVKNNVDGENLYAGIDGIVKSKNANEGNKVGPNAMICQISPNKIRDLKIQVYSPQQISIGQEIQFFKKDTFLGVSKIQFELPFKDNITQNYIYEITNPAFDIKEGDRLNIKLQRQLDEQEIWIPLEYISPRLEGNFVSLKQNEKIFETKIDIGEINGGFVKVNTGVNNGDIIVK